MIKAVNEKLPKQVFEEFIHLVFIKSKSIEIISRL